jgi:hypothetical protein
MLVLPPWCYLAASKPQRIGTDRIAKLVPVNGVLGIGGEAYSERGVAAAGYS